MTKIIKKRCTKTSFLFLSGLFYYSPVNFSCSSGYLAPVISMFSMCFLMSANSSCVKVISSAPIFSCSLSTFLVPGIGTIHGFWCNSQASAILAGISDRYSICRNISHNNASGADYCIISDCNPGDNCNICTNPDIFPYCYGFWKY